MHHKKEGKKRGAREGEFKDSVQSSFDGGQNDHRTYSFSTFVIVFFFI